MPLKLVRAVLKGFLPVLLLMDWTGLACAQGYSKYNNEWINYSNTYYKFKVGATGTFQIPESVLASAGLGLADASTFQLWRNGTQVPIYTSVASGQMPANGFIEFYGQKNDGKPDRVLYLQPSYQIEDQYSLFTDSATYFLTVNTGGGNLRVTNTGNNIAGNHLAPEPYYMATSATNYESYFFDGFYQIVDGSAIISSSFDAGEGYIYPAGFFPGSPYANIFPTLPIYAAGPPSTARIGMATVSFDNRQMQFYYTGSGPSVQLDDTTINSGAGAILQGTVPTSQLAAGPLTFYLANNNQSDPNDEFVVGFMSLTYPSTFNMMGNSIAAFKMPPSDTGNFLQVSNFSYGAAAPVLYDLTNGLRITGDLSNPGFVQWVLPPSATSHEIVMLSEDPSAVQTVTSLQSETFVNFSNVANQGNYLIISNPVLYNDGSGNNYVAQFQQYRSSPAGGGYNAKVIDISQLVDQFAFGIKMDPLSVKNFLRFARNTFAVKPAYCMLIGKAVDYTEIRAEENIPTIYKLALTPTFGDPASDILLANDSNKVGVGNATPIGRVSAVYGSEVGAYLEKVKEYETLQANYAGTIEADGWMKNVAHVVGADAQTAQLIENDMSNYQAIISDTLYGGNVSTFVKSSTTSVESVNGTALQALLNSGVGFVNYFGHSSSTVLEYNLDQASEFNMRGHYPVFFANGCQAGDMYESDSTRLLIPEGYTVTENFLLTPENGAIAYVGASSIGIVNYLDSYNTQFYNDISYKYYGLPLGQEMEQVAHDMGNSAFIQDFYGRCCVEQLSLDGDPEISLYHFSKPDYAIESPELLISPSIISVSNASFTVNAKWYNLGAAVNDSILIQVKWQLPNGTTTLLYNQKRAGPYYADSIQLTVPINGQVDAGSNTITVTLNADDKVSELSLANNSVADAFYIYTEEASPEYPFNYSIVGKTPVTFYASSADATDSVRNYIFEIDTTALFNSPLMVKEQVSSSGGLLTFSPSLSLRDSTVYYWRVAILPPTGNPTNWGMSSFWYMNGCQPGWDQSHYFQFMGDTYSSEVLDSDRAFVFPTITHTLQISNQLYPYSGDATDPVFLDNTIVTSGECGGNFGSLAFVLVNPTHATVLQDTQEVSGNYEYGSEAPCNTNYLFQFYDNTLQGREQIMAFLDSIPAGTIVGIYNWAYPGDNAELISAWLGDTATLGSGKSLYYSLKAIGFNAIDSFYHFVPIIYLGQKNASGTWTVYSQQGGVNPNDVLNASTSFTALQYQGCIASTYVGPAESWSSINWKGTWDATDSVKLKVYGVAPDSVETLLYCSNALQKDTTLSFISATAYPRLHLKLFSKDSINMTPYQLTKWQVHYQEVPEGAIAPNHYFNFPVDTLQAGQPLDFGVDFSNISNTAFPDSLVLLMTVT